jgi:hypothetical protein
VFLTRVFCEIPGFKKQRGSSSTYCVAIGTQQGRTAFRLQGRARYPLKTPYRDGTTHVVLVPRDFIARLAALAPKPESILRGKTARLPHNFVDVLQQVNS